ncbi:MAG TPA: hypothetical protein VLA21_07890, partial [Candidatus Limnocylindria bacterium]|nr:hypothetical protein [Candidatus Limnocylindria bacterium]
DFPHEKFVQQALEKHFSALDYVFMKEGNSDLVCLNNQGRDKWVIEAKGKTTEIGLDFRTGLGQLVQGIRERGVNYALAMPDIPQFAAQTKKLAPWLREVLNLHLIFINEVGQLRFVSPEDNY